jgi:hypothetical protein
MSPIGPIRGTSARLPICPTAGHALIAPIEDEDDDEYEDERRTVNREPRTVNPTFARAANGTYR